MKDNTHLLSLVGKYFEQDPVRAAHTLETMGSHEAVEVLKSIPAQLAAEAFNHLNDAFAAVLLPKLPLPLFSKITNQLDPQKGANIFIQFSMELRQQLLDNLEEHKKKQIQELLNFPEDSAGRIMTVDFIAFHGDVKARDAVLKIRYLAKKGSSASYIYVIDHEERLVGVLNMRDLLLADSQTKLEEVMRRDIFTVNCFDDREKIVDELKRRNYFVAPVVDHENRLLGIVKAEQLIAGVQEEATEDIQKMFGAGGNEKAFSPIKFSLSTRLPWLYVNLVTAFLAAAVVAAFEDIIAKITVLAVYLPVVAGQGGNAGAQSLAVVMRGLVMREIPPQKVRKLIFKETFVGLVNGVAIGIVTGLAAWLWQGNPVLGLVVALGMLVNLTVAGLSGAIIPISMKAMHLDPAQCSNIILTTITDVMGFFAFLGFAVIFQDYLM